MDEAMPAPALHTRHWPRAEATPARGAVVIVHGVGEHVGRYAHVAERLNAWGFDVHGFDQYGHGRSPGKRGTLHTPTRLLDDLANRVDAVRADLLPGQPLLVLGHSMGGLLAARFTALAMRPLDGLVLSSPALASGMRRDQRWLAALLAKIAPGFTIANGLPPEGISHDAAEVAAYRSDPLGHDRISGRLAHFIDSAGPPTLAAAPHWTVPTLLLFAGDDRLVDAAGSRRFAAAAPADVVTSQEFPRAYHELFNETDAVRAAVFAALQAWLDAHFPG